MALPILGSSLCFRKMSGEGGAVPIASSALGMTRSHQVIPGWINTLWRWHENAQPPLALSFVLFSRGISFLFLSYEQDFSVYTKDWHLYALHLCFCVLFMIRFQLVSFAEQFKFFVQVNMCIHTHLHTQASIQIYTHKYINIYIFSSIVQIFFFHLLILCFVLYF